MSFLSQTVTSSDMEDTIYNDVQCGTEYEPQFYFLSNMNLATSAVTEYNF